MMIRPILNTTFITLIVVSLIACSWNKSSGTTVNEQDSLSDFTLPDTSPAKVDSFHKATVMRDTGWKQAVEKFSKPNPVNTSSIESKGKDLGFDPPAPKQGPPPMVNPFRPPILLEGLKKAQAGNLQGAILDFDSALRKNPKNYNAYFYRAKAKIESGNSNSALDDLNKAIENLGNEALYYYYRGKLYSDMGQSDKAMADFSAAIKFKPDFTDAWNYRGVEKAKQGRHEEAIMDYDSALSFNPSYALTFYNKGTSLASLGQFQPAVESFSKSIQLKSDHVLSYLNRGNCNVQLKKYKDAIADYNRAIELEPQNSDAYYNRGAAHYLSTDGLYCPDWKKAAAMGNTRAKEMVEKYCK